MKVFLGIHVGHNASAALMVNGEIKFALQEERFTNQKNFMGFPEKSLKYLENYARIKNLTIDTAAFSSTKGQLFELKYPINRFFSVKEFDDYYGEKFYSKKLKGGKTSSYINSLQKDNRFKKLKNIFSKTSNKYLFGNYKKIQEIKKKKLEQIFKHKISNICFLDHHMCHAYYGKFSIDNKEKNYAVIVLDSIGDEINQSIWLPHIKKGYLKNIIRNNQCELGRIYKFTTLIINMKHNEHEFKVMGMDPYAKEH